MPSLTATSATYDTDSWDGAFNVAVKTDDETGAVISAYAEFSYVGKFTAEGLSAMIDRAAEAGSGDLSAKLLGIYSKLDQLTGWHNPDGDDSIPETVSQEANSYFPTIETETVNPDRGLRDNDTGFRFVRDNLKKIGVVVYKMFLDPSEGNKINFEPVEAYAGSLYKDDKDPNTGATTFIDTIINSQSQYINFFSNCFNTAKDRKYYKEKLDMFVVQPGAWHPDVVDIEISKVKDFPYAIDILAAASGIGNLTTDTVGAITINVGILEQKINELEGQHPDDIATLHAAREAIYALMPKVTFDTIPDTTAPSLGFYAEMTKEDISITKSIYDGMNKSFEKVEDINQLDIDIIPDAGLANIASYLKALYGNKGAYDLQITDDVGNSLLGMWKCNGNNAAVKTWKTVEQKLDNFCKNVRKDCMFIADGPRPLVLAGQKKIVRPSKPANTIDANIVPNLKFITGLNTSYGACYVDWFEMADDYSGDFFWCPPSIKAMGVYINTDVNFNYWDAPAGLNRGVITATDVAFSPTIKQAGCSYEIN